MQGAICQCDDAIPSKVVCQCVSSAVFKRRRSSSGSLAMLADAPRLVFGQQVRRRRLPSRLILEINVGERLPVVIAHDEAGVEAPSNVQVAALPVALFVPLSGAFCATSL
jgi:hypothetical protein